MSNHKTISRRHVGLLAIANGLIVGRILELLFTRVYYNWEFQRAADYAYKIGAKIPVERGPLILHNPYAIPFSCVLAFTVVSFLLIKLLHKNRISLFVYWMLAGIIGITIAFILYFSTTIYRLFPYSDQPTIQHYFSGLLWTWFVCLLIAAIINCLYGAIIQITLEAMNG